MDINQASLQMHYDLHGKIEVISRKKIEPERIFPLLIHQALQNLAA